MANITRFDLTLPKKTTAAARKLAVQWLIA
jgi:hypothetical protein